ncbi:LPD7 domain-containing protein [Paraburkholderia flagellata]|uniref:LPD7 domain-containing protein n=1 Tax=Paraburkholderia flagellata TaxID=2883241 RepID=UPI001F158AEE|nr:LPD7 domain-containing protein [Paraburkholderia flagellata]
MSENNEIGFQGGLARENPYRMVQPGVTSSWDEAANDVNGRNADGLRPIEVAARALNVVEFLTIASQPDFNPADVDPRAQASLARDDDFPQAAERYDAFIEALETYDRFVRAAHRLHPEREIEDALESRLDDGLPTIETADNPRIAPLDIGTAAANDDNARNAANDPDKTRAQPTLQPDLERARLARAEDREAFERAQADLAALLEKNGGRVGKGPAQAPQAATETGREAQGQQAADGGKEGEGNEVKAAPIFREKGYEVPASVVAQYVAFDGKYLHRQTEVVHFHDKGRKLSTDSEDKAVVRSMIEVAKAKNWGEVQLKGSEEFRRQAWVAAELAGIKSTGFKPKAQDRALLQAAREEMRISAGEREAGRSEGANTVEVSAGARAAEQKPAEQARAAAEKPAEPQAATEKAAAPQADDAAAVQAARAAFMERGRAIQAGARPGFDALSADTARKVLEQRIKGFSPEVQARFRNDMERQIEEARKADTPLAIPVPKADRILVEAAKMQQEAPARAAETAPEVPSDIER